MENWEQSVFAILYPERILLSTRNKRDEYVWYFTSEIAELPINVSDGELGIAVIKLMEKSQTLIKANDEIKALWQTFKRLGGFKTEKAIYENAKCVVVVNTGTTFRFEPQRTKLSDRAFYALPKLVTEKMFKENLYTQLGQELRSAWSNCEHSLN